MTKIDERIQRIERIIEEAISRESSTSQVTNVIREAAAKSNEAITEDEVVRGLHFVIHYVRSVPNVLREAIEGSRNTFAEDKMARMVVAAATYWDAEDDIIPDDQGLLGILDDAYCSLSLVITLSDRFEKDTGTKLVHTDLHGPTKAVRRLLGDPIATKLDSYVEEALADSSMQQLLDSLRAQPPAPPPANSHWAPHDDQLILKIFGVLGEEHAG